MENFSQSAPVNMAPTGIATFAKCPICPDIRQIQADIAVIGAPCDMAIQGRPAPGWAPGAYVPSPPAFASVPRVPMIQNGTTTT